MSKQVYQKAGLIIALAIAGFTLPTSIISLMETPTTPTIVVNNYYYNNTIIEQHNSTIIEQYNTTIIEYYNETVYINNTIYIPINRTVDYYFCDDVQFQEWFLNITYDITNTTVIFITISSDNHPSLFPQVWLYKDSVNVYNEKIDYGSTIGFVFVSGDYEIRFFNSPSTIQDFFIAIEQIEL